MNYIKKYHRIEPEEGCMIHQINDYGYRTEDNKYIPPILSEGMYLAKNISKEQAFEWYEDVELSKISEYKKEWKKKLKEQLEFEQQERQYEENQEPELEDFDEEDE